MKKLRLILGDQLNYNHSWFEKVDENNIYVIMEIKPELEYTKHHIQKIIAFFLAMRSFSDYMKEKGHKFIYYKIDDQNNHHSLSQNILELINQYKIDMFEYQLPDEYRLDIKLKNICVKLNIKTSFIDSEHFLSTRVELETFFEGKKSFVMEYFYRYMRKKYNVLVDGDKPINGKWNFDTDNRKSFKEEVKVPDIIKFKKNVEDLYKVIQSMNIETIGNINLKNFVWGITREDALESLNYFLENNLKYFGTYQDAMHTKHHDLFHSRISFYLNTKILHPFEVIESAIFFYNKNKNSIDYSQIEGFVRQIIGWREFMRGIYWAKMPEFSQMNYFNHQEKLPVWYWTGNTKMNCLKNAISQSLDDAYAHHIQRLMITGNFALLLGVNPDEVDQWYLGIYIDAIQWVEITNTRGMSQFADGGIIATKPYVSSAAYINKMSDYCKSCYYDKSKRTGDKACPFNSLYWDFFDRNREKLERNPRIGIAYANLNKMSQTDLNEMRIQAKSYKMNSDKL